MPTSQKKSNIIKKKNRPSRVVKVSAAKTARAIAAYEHANELETSTIPTTVTEDTRISDYERGFDEASQFASIKEKANKMTERHRFKENVACGFVVGFLLSWAAIYYAVKFYGFHP